MQQAINRGFDILEFVAREPENATSFNDIAKHTGLNTGTCANIIKALVQRGYLEKLDVKKGYLPGKKLYELTNGTPYKKDLVKFARPVLDALTEKFNENSLIAVLKESSRFVLYQSTSQHDIQANSSTYKSAYDSATGRLLLAMLADEDLDRFVAKYGLPPANQWKTATTKQGIKKAVQDIRTNGHVLQESDNGIVGYAAGVSQGTEVVAAISVYFPSYRLGSINKEELLTELKAAAKKVSDNLSF